MQPKSAIAQKTERNTQQGRRLRRDFVGAIAKWLRRQIRIAKNHLFLFEGAGSNPAGVDQTDLCFF
jgi:hypothetical protein